MGRGEVCAGCRVGEKDRIAEDVVKFHWDSHLLFPLFERSTAFCGDPRL